MLVSSDGRLLAVAERPHQTSTPKPGWFEHDPEAIWWDEFVAVTRELLGAHRVDVAAVGVSGIGPCFLPATADGRPLRPAILYGVDTRATAEVAELTERFGAEAILESGGSALSSQAVGPKMLWVQRHETQVWAQTRRFFMASSFLVHRLTGAYALDHHSASQCDPLYDIERLRWREDWAGEAAPGLELPPLLWPGERAGEVSAAAADATGLPAGIPVACGTVDAWSEALSAGVSEPGQVMLMYGTTLFLVAVTGAPVRHPSLWATAGVLPGTWSVAAGLATGGALTTWARDLTGAPLEALFAEAASVPAGSDGLLVLPYFAGERTPVFDPLARGVVAGLTLAHGRGHVFRALLEATALAVRHNLEAMREAGAHPERLAAVGGGTRGPVWLQIVSDVTGVPHDVPEVTVGAAFGDAMLAALASGSRPEDVRWNRLAGTVEPDARHAGLWDERFALYRSLYEDTKGLVHRLSG